VVQNPQEGELPRSPEVARQARSQLGRESRVRLSVPVPPLVQAALAHQGKSPTAELNRVIGELFRKLTPQRGPNDKGPYAGEVLYFERLRDAPIETLTLAERMFVHVVQAHQLLLDLRDVEGPDAVRGDVEQLTQDLAEWVDAAQEIVRAERGPDHSNFDWEATS